MAVHFHAIGIQAGRDGGRPVAVRVVVVVPGLGHRDVDELGVGFRCRRGHVLVEQFCGGRPVRLYFNRQARGAVARQRIILHKRFRVALNHGVDTGHQVRQFILAVLEVGVFDRQRRCQRVGAENLKGQVADIGEGIIILLHFFINGLLEFPGIFELQRGTSAACDINGIGHLAVRGIHHIAFHQRIRVGIADQVGALERLAQGDGTALHIIVSQRLFQVRIRAVKDELQSAQVRPFRRVQGNVQFKAARPYGVRHLQFAVFVIRIICGECLHLLYGVIDVVPFGVLDGQVRPILFPARGFYQLGLADRFFLPGCVGI